MHITGNILEHRDSLHFLWGKHLQCISMRDHFFLHYGCFFQNLRKEAVWTFMHTTWIVTCAETVKCLGAFREIRMLELGPFFQYQSERNHFEIIEICSKGHIHSLWQITSKIMFFTKSTFDCLFQNSGLSYFKSWKQWNISSFREIEVRGGPPF